MPCVLENFYVKSCNYILPLYELTLNKLMDDKPNVAVLTVTFDNDLKWLDKSWRSYSAFCKNYSSYNVIIDDHEEDCEQSRGFLEYNNISYHVDTKAKYIPVGYVRQQYMKFNCDKYVPEDTDWICHVDSDSLFYAEHTPDIYFGKSGKPIMLIESYEAIEQNHSGESNEHWRDIITKALKLDEPVEYEFMRRMPLVYPKWLFEEVREWFIENHNMSVFEYLQDVDNFTEYNFLGAYCWKYHHDLYEWVDIADEKSEWLDIPFMQEYSHQDSFDKEKLIEYLLSVPGVYLWMVDVIAAAKKNGCNLYGINPDHYGFNRNMELRELYKGLLHITHPHIKNDWPK